MKKATVKNTLHSSTLHLGEKLTIHHLTKYHQDNQHLLNLNQIHIDASKVVDIDTAALQLITYYILSIKEHHGIISWEGTPSPHFIEQAKTCGMSNILI